MLACRAASCQILDGPEKNHGLLKKGWESCELAFYGSLALRWRWGPPEWTEQDEL